jgi:hypothetical protein
MTKYQIIGKNDENVSFVLYSFDELKLATKTFEWVSQIAKSYDCNVICHLPPWQSIELQQVETLALVTIEDEP